MLIVNYFGAEVGRRRTRVIRTGLWSTIHRPSSGAQQPQHVVVRFGTQDFGAQRRFPLRSRTGRRRPAASHWNHLLTRLDGDDARAWDQFNGHEDRIGIEPRAMSAISARLLEGVDMGRARRRRQSNFETVHRKLGPLNAIELSLRRRSSSDGPMCIPFYRRPTSMGRAPRRIRAQAVAGDQDPAANRHSNGNGSVARRLLPLPRCPGPGPLRDGKAVQTLLQVLP